MKFRKKPVVIEARQITENNLEEIEAWCGGSIKGDSLPRNLRLIVIPTREGGRRALIGDWVIKGVAGEFYPCRPASFADIYEPVEE